MAQYRYLKKFHGFKKKKSILKNRFFWLSILLLLILGGIFYLFFFFSYFQIKEIKISENNKVKAEAIKSQVDKKISQKILFWQSQSIFLANLNEISGIILNSIPEIAAVDLKKKFPQTLEVKIKERESVAVFSSDSGDFLIDKEGVIFESFSSEQSDLLKIKKSDSEGKKAPGEKVLEAGLLSKALTIFDKLKKMDIALKEIFIVSKDRLNFKTSDGYDIYFDPEKDIDWQLIKLESAFRKEISKEKRNNLEYIDLRFGNFAPYKTH